MWTCRDGREVLFDRQYKPLWQRRAGQSAERADPLERVPFTEQTWFYTDGNSPRFNPATERRCKQVLVEWSVPQEPRKANS